jgi:hypothetical protein
MVHRSSLGLLAASVTLILGGAVAFSACSAGNDDTGGGQSGGGDAVSTGTGVGGSLFTGSGGGGPTDAILVEPKDPTLTVEFGTPGQTVQFTAKSAMSGDPVTPKWSLSTPAAGLIDASGLFTSNGNAGGKITVTATSGMSTGSTTLTINLHALEDPGTVSPGDQGTLKGPAGQTDPAWSIWYPYDKTIFPRGILPPEIHSSTTAMSPTAYYLHITATGFEYEGFFGALPQIAMSQATWDALGNSTDGGDVKVEISKLVSAQKYGPVAQTWRVAKGKLHGTIYYNTYDSPMAGTGAMMRIKGNSPSPEVFVGNCTVCHSISSDGSTAAAANHAGPGGTFDLSGGNVNPPLVWTDPERAAFAALFPKNGDVLVINGAPGGSYPPNTPGTNGPWPSELRTKAGTIVPASGIEGYYAQSPVFSHDGTMLAFCDRNPSSLISVLALMNYDAATQKFTNYQVLATPPSGRHFSWPAFTPDNKYVVYQDGQGDDLATWQANTGKLWAVNVQTKAAMALSIQNGDGYMPGAGAGSGRDEDLNYEPTILPIGSGGYFWIMFTSRRTYGNRLMADRSGTKRLWVSAFDVNATDGIDPTHPGFYIAGQELASGNSRGFWALDPCKQNGNSCESGDECCEGFCNPDPNDPSKFSCAPPSGGCSDEFENCMSAADCCDPSLQCIGGKCTQIPPP